MARSHANQLWAGNAAVTIFLEIAFLLLITLVAAAFGGRVLRILRLEAVSFPLTLVMSVALGYGLFSYLTLFVGLLGGGKQAIRIAVIVVGALCGAEIPVLYRRIVLELRSSSLPAGWLNGVLASMLALCIVANLVGTLAPISSIDALDYHADAPKVWLQGHRIVPIQDNWLTFQPLNVEMLYMLGMAVDNDVLGMLFHWSFSVLLALAIAGVSKEWFAEANGLVAAGIFYVSGLVAWEATSGYVELGTALYTLLAVYALLRWRDEAAMRWLALGGVFAGLAAATKFTGAVVPAILLMLVVFAPSRAQDARRVTGNALKRAMIFCVPVALLLLPWYLRSYLATGDPVFPFLSLGSHPGLKSDLAAVAARYGYGKRPIDLVLLPFRLTLAGSRFDLGQLLGPLYLVFVPFSLMAIRRSPKLRVIWIFCVAFVLVWFYSTQQVRFLAPVLPLAAIACAVALGEMEKRASVFRTAARTALVLGLLYGCAITLYYNAQFVPVVAGREYRDAFLSRKTQFYPQIQWMNRNLPATARVLVMPRGAYYLDHDHHLPSNAGTEEFDLESPGARAFLRRNGITHIFCTEDPGDTSCSYVQRLGMPARVLLKETAPLIASRTLGTSAGEVHAEVLEIHP